MADEPNELIENLAISNPRAEGRGGGRGRGGRGRGGHSRGGGGGGGGMDREVLISKALSKLLRHDAENAGLALDAEGFARVDQVLQYPRLKSLGATFSEIQAVVKDNAKQRFSLKPISTSPDPPEPSPSNTLIRANQGHSLALDSSSLLSPISLELTNIPPVVVHGTYFAFYPLILASGGLSKMSRNHVHFGTGVPEDDKGVISGMRKDAELLVFVDVKKALEEGLKWWISENGVVLTEGDEQGLVSTRFWKKVVGRREDVGTLWEDGVEVGELPERVRGRKAPTGKGHRGGGGGGGGRGRDRGRGRAGRGGDSGIQGTDRPAE